MNNLKKYFEISFFIIANLIFTSNSLAMLCIMMISNLLSLVIFQANPVYKNDYPFVFFVLILVLIFFILKIILFPILYNHKKQFPYIYNFFNTIFINKKNTIGCFLILFGVLILDAFIYLLVSHENHIEQLYIECFGLGLIPSYLIMLIYLRIKKHNQIK